jgi:hypothetical protein
MGKSKYAILFSFLIFFIIFLTIYSDFGGFFNYSDAPFMIVFFLYVLFLFIQKGTGKISFGIALFILVFMGLSYIPTGASFITERIGEWFYLFFSMGLIQSIFALKKRSS